ncbi:hypothetical protein Enr13x_31980 [Stieleria neptunia]|uniref:Fimbrial assembly protein (PilN) n=1 Tax=Stieleria neptunia TaxID=2527979 RepID=A0A518HR65_9BACT|nr:hypothetical protein [Stieleria neptunia]QDV43343.1 hypothetical protein Enr13x_31980 [Stieleria neptunia]
MMQLEQHATTEHDDLGSVGIDFVPEPSDAMAPMPWPPDAPTAAVPCQNVTDGLGGWQDFELMPPHYRARRHAEQAFQKWSVVLLVLLSITVGSSVTLWLRGRRTIAKNAVLVEQAQPIAELRRTTRLLKTENALLEKWCTWVESAKPDDSVAQVLGAVAQATHPGPKVPAAQHLDVQSIEVKLPLEYDVSLKEPPSWAVPRVSLTAVANSRDVLMPWNDRLEQSGRLQEVQLNTPGGAWREALIQVTAQPLSSTLLP